MINEKNNSINESHAEISARTKKVLGLERAPKYIKAFAAAVNSKKLTDEQRVEFLDGIYQALKDYSKKAYAEKDRNNSTARISIGKHGDLGESVSQYPSKSDAWKTGYMMVQLDIAAKASKRVSQYVQMYKDSAAYRADRTKGLSDSEKTYIDSFTVSDADRNAAAKKRRAELQAKAKELQAQLDNVTSELNDLGDEPSDDNAGAEDAHDNDSSDSNGSDNGSERQDGGDDGNGQNDSSDNSDDDDNSGRTQDDVPEQLLADWSRATNPYGVKWPFDVALQPKNLKELVELIKASGYADDDLMADKYAVFTTNNEYAIGVINQTPGYLIALKKKDHYWKPFVTRDKNGAHIIMLKYDYTAFFNDNVHALLATIDGIQDSAARTVAEKKGDPVIGWPMSIK